MYRFSQYPTAAGDDVPRAQLLGSGVALPWVLKAQQILAEEYSVAADIWSVTSWNELRRDAVDAERAQPAAPRTSRSRCRSSPSS